MSSLTAKGFSRVCSNSSLRVRNAKCKMDIQREKPRSSYEITKKSGGDQVKQGVKRNPSREGIHPRSHTDIAVGRTLSQCGGRGRGDLQLLSLRVAIQSQRSVCMAVSMRKVSEKCQQRGWKWPLPGRGRMQGEDAAECRECQACYRARQR